MTLFIRRLPIISGIEGCLRSQQRTIFGLGTATRKNEVMSYGERRLIGFTAEQMFDVVYTVAEYPRFVPWCKRADVHKINDRVFEAELYIGFPPLSEHYTSRVTSLYPNVIRMETIWRFGPPEAGYPPHSCSLDFSLDFQFKSVLHAQLAHVFFGQVVRKMVCAFLKRAEQLYGPPSFDHFSTDVQVTVPKV